MPELPEVQTLADDLISADLVGTTITGIRVNWPRSIGAPAIQPFIRQIKGRTINHIGRRGKWLVFRLDDSWTLLLHLRMSGRLIIVANGRPYRKHEHVIFKLDDGRQLRFHDTRKFGRFYLLIDPETILGRLGPEPLSRRFTARLLTRRLAGRRRQLKPLLLDQSFIAGLGNIYVDEALWQAGLHPQIQASQLNRVQIKALHRSIRKVLRRGLTNAGTSLGSGLNNFTSIGRRAGRNRKALNVFRRTGKPCPRCGQVIERIIVGQRSTHFCSTCQRVSERYRSR